jgi:hypothetical protein
MIRLLDGLGWRLSRVRHDLGVEIDGACAQEEADWHTTLSREYSRVSPAKGDDRPHAAAKIVDGARTVPGLVA